MEANVTLHWFVHPRWFDELGGWRRSENVRYYVEWAELAFKLWGQYMARPSHHTELRTEMQRVCFGFSQYTREGAVGLGFTLHETAPEIIYDMS